MSKITSIELKYYKSSLDITSIYQKLFTENSIVFPKRKDDVKSGFIYLYFVDFGGLEIYMDNDNEYIGHILKIMSKKLAAPIGFSCYINDMNLHHTIYPDFGEYSADRFINIQITSPRMIKSMDIPDFSFYASNLLAYFDMKMVRVVEFSYF